MKRLCSFAALVLLSTSAHAGTMFSFAVEGRVFHINAPSGCASLACISVSSPEFRGSNYRRGSSNKPASKAVSAKVDKARAPAGTPNSLSLVKTPNAEDAIAAPRTPISTAKSRPVVVSTEPMKASSIDMPAPPATVVGTRPSPTDSDAASGPTSLTQPMPVDATSDESASPVNVADTVAPPAPPATVVGTRPSPTDSNAASGPTSLTKPMPVDAASDGSASPVNVAATSSHSPSPSTVESATPITGSVYKPVQTALSSAPAAEYYSKAKEDQTPAPAVEYYRKAKENQNRETFDGGRPASLLGNWQTEGQKRAIRIEQCGPLVCGYVADSSNKDKVLIDLKPTSSSEWIGLIVSAESGIMYPSVVILEDAKTLRVRACALGMAFCEGQIWTRADPVLAAVH
jgi:hypothetical protein